MVYLFLVLLAVSVIMIFIMARGAPYVGTSPSRVKTMVEMAGVHPGERAADIGSGDGRVVIALAQAGADASGFELNPVLVWLSRRAIRRAGLSGRARVRTADFWDIDFSGFDIVTVYGISYIMARLEKKLLKELKPGARVVSNNFVFPNWQPIETRGRVRLYIKQPSA